MPWQARLAQMRGGVRKERPAAREQTAARAAGAQGQEPLWAQARGEPARGGAAALRVRELLQERKRARVPVRERAQARKRSPARVPERTSVSD